MAFWPPGAFIRPERQMPDEEPSVLRQLARLSTVGVALVAATAIGLAIGYGLDRWLGTGPWLTMVFTLFGIVAGFLNLFRDLGLLRRTWR
jgi:F0F1-type ATP synthase assembly protein I